MTNTRKIKSNLHSFDTTFNASQGRYFLFTMFIQILCTYSMIFPTYARSSRILMSGDDEVAKKRWLSNLHKPFGTILSENNQHLTSMSNTTENNALIVPPIHDEIELPVEASYNNEFERESKKAWFQNLDQPVKPEGESHAKKEWLDKLDKAVVPSKEDLAKKKWLDNLKSELQSSADNTFK